MDFHPNPSMPSLAETILNDLSRLVLRFTTGLTMIYFQGWHQSVRAWEFVWEKQSWTLVDQFRELGFAIPGIVATTVVVLCTVLSLGVITGVYTRACAFLLLIVVGFALAFPAELSGSLNVQALLLYAGMSLTLIFCGSGRASLDFLLTRQKEEIP